MTEILNSISEALDPYLRPVLEHLGLEGLNRQTGLLLLVLGFVITKLVRSIIQIKNRRKPKPRYTGPRDTRGRFSGDEGVMEYPNGDRYTGGFRGGLKHGKGVYRFANGCTLSGEFQAGVIIRGEETYTTGAVYRGGFNPEGQRHGLQGEMELPNLGRYTGGFQDGNRHGYGELVFLNGARYFGWWKRHRREGLALYRGPDREMEQEEEEGEDGGTVMTQTQKQERRRKRKKVREDFRWTVWENDELIQEVPEHLIPEKARKLMQAHLGFKVDWPELMERVRIALDEAEEGEEKATKDDDDDDGDGVKNELKEEEEQFDQ